MASVSDETHENRPVDEDCNKTAAEDDGNETAEKERKEEEEGGGDDDDTANASGVRELRGRHTVARRGRGGGRGKQLAVRRLTRAAIAAAKTKRGGRGASPNVALLDMLAEVASATLKSDPTIKSPKRALVGRPAKTSVESAAQKKGPVTADQLNLDQIRMLSDKLLLNMFADLTADEIRRNYSYRCFLMPEKCQQEYTSFGNEAKARAQMKSHLLGHITKLLTDAKAPGRSPRNKFIAESVTCRKRRMEAQQSTAERRAKVSRRLVGRGGGAPVPAAASGRFTQMRPPRQSSRGRGAHMRQQKLARPAATPRSETSSDDDQEQLEEEEDEEENDGVVDEGDVMRVMMSSDGLQEVVQQQIEIEAVDEEWNPEDVEMQINEYIEVVDHSSQPHHDHCYTYLEGDRRTPEPQYWGEGDVDEGSNVLVEMEEVVCAEETDGQPRAEAGAEQQNPDDAWGFEQPSVEASSSSHDYEATPTQRTVGERPKATRARGSRQDSNQWKFVDDEIVVEPDNFNQGTPGWERTMALKCIRQLRTKKKDERVQLICRICPSHPKFTAQATLMYHYRSHAGIKPFPCLICHTSFTRQHSLNYHMLIHNNKSRFTCTECSREFRHPSHFKEHKRRHTGETPFECSECGIRFKTRNTYKRHLKTRHGKLLTVSGIVDLSAEEFNKCRTKPKKVQYRDNIMLFPTKGMAAAKCIAAEEAAEAALLEEEASRALAEQEEIDNGENAIHDDGIGVMEEEELTEQQPQMQMVSLQADDSTAQVLHALSQAAGQSRHELGDVIIQAYVITNEDGSTQIALCPQSMYAAATGAPVTLPDAPPVQIKLEPNLEHSEEEEDNSEAGMEGQQILGLANNEDESHAAVGWINANAAEAVYGEDEASVVHMHAVVPCT